MCAQRTGLLIPFLNQESVSEEEHTEMMIHLLHAAFVYQAPDGEVEALRDVSLDVEEGEFCSIVGPSGCGKSTLLSVLAGLETLTGGEVTVDGETLRGPSPKVGFMPQQDQLFPWRSIWDNVTLALAVRGENTPENQARVRSLLERYGLWAFRDKRPGQLSGGMRQRCALIRTPAVGFGGYLPHHPAGGENRPAGDPRHQRGHQHVGPGGGADPAARRDKGRSRHGTAAGPAAYGAAGHPGISHVFQCHLEGAGAA